METYCSTQCAREDTLRALMGEENAYRQKIQARQMQPPPKNAGRRYVEKLVPRIFVSADRQLPPTPSEKQLPPTPPPKISAPQVLYSTKENHPAPPRPVPSTPRPNISSPYALQPHGVAYTTLGAGTSRHHLPAVGESPYVGPRPAKKSPQNLNAPRHPVPAVHNNNQAIRRSASESQMKGATIHSACATRSPDLKDPPLTYYLQPPGALEIRPAVVAPTAQLFVQSSYLQVPSERRLRHSKSFSPYKPFFPVNVPEDVNQDNLSYRISGDVWWVVKALREGDDVDYKAQFLARQTPRW